MKSAAISEIKKELSTVSPKKLAELCLRLARFKKENKELLAFLLFDADNETSFVESVKLEIDEYFQEINTSNWYFSKKSLRKILRSISKYARFTVNKESEVEMIIHFIKSMKMNGYLESNYKAIITIYETQFNKVTKLVNLLHEDLQHDYKVALHGLTIDKVTNDGIMGIVRKMVRKS